MKYAKKTWFQDKHRVTLAHWIWFLSKSFINLLTPQPHFLVWLPVWDFSMQILTRVQSTFKNLYF